MEEIFIAIMERIAEKIPELSYIDDIIYKHTILHFCVI